MDPQTLSFTPQSDIWRLSSSMRNFQEIQQEHADRLVRLEKRQDEDARVKSVWGRTSPFPGVLSGTTQQGTGGYESHFRLCPKTLLTSALLTGLLHQTSGAEFTDFDDDQSNNMVRSLHLETDNEPRRLGATSRANSVRFDESANQGQWSHASRLSMDFTSRAPIGFGGLGGLGGLGGHPMHERSTSHKSDGRYSSAGQSAISGRANSLGLDTSHLLGPSAMDVPGLAPGLFILGSVPSIIRCWLNTNFKHESLLYAAVCTGSYKSFLDAQLIDQLGFSGQICQDINGDRKIKVPVYLPEAIPHPNSSRSSSPAGQLPTLIVDFTVLDHSAEDPPSKAIQIFLGSDMLRAHNADVLFSSNVMTLFDDDRGKLSIPLVRPEHDGTFKSLYITSGLLSSSKYRVGSGAFGGVDQKLASKPLPNGTGSAQYLDETSHVIEPQVTPDAEKQQAPGGVEADIDSVPATTPASLSTSTANFEGHGPQTSLGLLNTTKLEPKDSPDQNRQITSSNRTSSSPAIWSNWRRDGNTAQASQNDWANASRNAGGTYQRPNRDQGMKVLKPIRQVSRNSIAPLSASPVTGQSRFFDDGRRRSGLAGSTDSSEAGQSRRSGSGDRGKAFKENLGTSTAAPGSKPRTANPIGSASAFGWLNSGQQQK